MPQNCVPSITKFTEPMQFSTMSRKGKQRVGAHGTRWGTFTSSTMRNQSASVRRSLNALKRIRRGQDEVLQALNRISIPIDTTVPGTEEKTKRRVAKTKRRLKAIGAPVQNIPVNCSSRPTKSTQPTRSKKDTDTRSTSSAQPTQSGPSTQHALSPDEAETLSSPTQPSTDLLEPAASAQLTPPAMPTKADARLFPPSSIEIKYGRTSPPLRTLTPETIESMVRYAEKRARRKEAQNCCEEAGLDETQHEKPLFRSPTAAQKKRAMEVALEKAKRNAEEVRPWQGK